MPQNAGSNRGLAMAFVPESTVHTHVLSRSMREKLLFLFVSAFACLITGWLIGVFSAQLNEPLSGPGLAATAPASATFTPTPPLNRPVTILFLVVDSLAASKPQMDGCWVLTFLPQTSQYFLIGFPLDTPVANNYRLLDYYNAGRNLEDAALFVSEGVRSASDHSLQVQYQVRLDQAALAETVNRLGGVTLAGEWLDGSALLQRYAALPPEAYRPRAEFQRDALQSMADVLLRQSWTAEALDQWLPGYRPFSPDADDLYQIMLTQLPLNGAELHIKVFEPPSP